jgi:CRISPR-associated protein Csx17
MEFGSARLLVEERLFVKRRVRITNPTPNRPRTRLVWWPSAGQEPNAKPAPDVFHLLASGRADAVGQCVTRAAQRLKSGGLLVTGYRNRVNSGRVIEAVSAFPPTRLLAAMLFPLSDRDLARIANAVLFPPESEE